MLSVLLFGTLYTYRLLIITDSPIVSILSSYPAHTPARLFTCFVSHTPHDNAATAVRVCIMSLQLCVSDRMIPSLAFVNYSEQFIMLQLEATISYVRWRAGGGIPGVRHEAFHSDHRSNLPRTAYAVRRGGALSTSAEVDYVVA